MPGCSPLLCPTFPGGRGRSVAGCGMRAADDRSRYNIGGQDLCTRIDSRLRSLTGPGGAQFICLYTRDYPAKRLPTVCPSSTCVVVGWVFLAGIVALNTSLQQQPPAKDINCSLQRRSSQQGRLIVHKHGYLREVCRTGCLLLRHQTNKVDGVPNPTPVFPMIL